MLRDEELFLPVAVVQEWKGHSECGAQFDKWLKDCLDLGHKIINPEEEAKKKESEEQNQTNGSGNNGTSNPGPSPKKRRTGDSEALDQKFFLKVEDISEALISEVKLQAKDWPVLQMRGSGCYLVNQTGKNWQQTDPCIALFGSGSYKILKAGQELPNNCVELNLKGYQDLVIVGGAVTTLQSVVQEMRNKKPDCRVSYYEIDTTASLSEFELKPTHRVVFCQKTEDGAVLAKHNCAFQLPFRTSGCLKLIWHMRWTQKGLAPIKPAVHLVGTVQLPSGQCLKLHEP